VARVTSKRHVPVLIVGAGPTGLLLAAELRRRDVEGLLVDALPEPLAWDRATVVHPRSLEVFDALGIVDAFLAAGVRQSIAQVRSGGELLGAIDLTDCGSRYPFNLGMSEQVTEGILLDHLHGVGGAVQRGTRLADLACGADGVRAVLEHGDGTREEVSADWIVGCDGLHSLTRERAGIELAGHDIAVPWAVFDATAANWTEPYDVNHVLLDQPVVILTALPGRRWRVYLRPSGPDSDLVADASATVHRYHPDVDLVDVANPRRFHCHTKVATRYRSGRVLLAGDAAHVCSPAEGHGMNSGLQDAFNLGWKLALVCHGDADPALLDSYEAERRPVAERITASGDAVEGAQTLADAAQRLARDATLRATFADPDGRHHEALAEAELDIDYGDSPIVLGTPWGDLRPGERLGDRLPQARRGTGHIAILVAAPSAPAPDTAAIAAAHPRLIDATVVVRSDGPGETALVVVRPDGHIGAVAPHDHRAALDEYAVRLGAAGG
jgi:2-polyprenyl-6-methoxyphenol hydroxylase-like FAD-dependent oxidoreductase